MNEAPPNQQQIFQQFKQEIRAKSLGLIEDALNNGRITPEEFAKEREAQLCYYIKTVGGYARHHGITLPITLPSPSELNQEEVLLMAFVNPILFRWLELWEQKELTWEQATYGIIWALLRDVGFWRDRYREIIEKHPMGIWLQPNDYTVIVKKKELQDG